MHYREAGPADGKILFLLHGSAFNSRHWKDIKTIQTMAAAGNKVYAVDLPGEQTGSGGRQEAQIVSQNWLFSLYTLLEEG